MPASRSVAMAAVIGLAAGGAGAVLLLPGGNGAAPAAATTTTAASTTTAPAWVNRRETRIGPAVVVADGLQMEGDRVLFTYVAAPIVPLADGVEGPMAGNGATAAPASLTLTYAGGTAAARVLAPSQRSARFEVPPGFTLDQVQGIRIDSYWVAAPARFPIALSASSGAWVAAAPGVRARILQVVEQAANRLVIVEVEGDAAVAGDLSIAGEGPDWRSSSSSQLGTPRWTLDFRGTTLPDPIPLLARGLAWVEVPGGGSVDIEGIAR